MSPKGSLKRGGSFTGKAIVSSRSEGRPQLATLFVELAVEVQSLEDELDRRRDRGRIAGGAELADRALHAGDLQRLLHVLLARERRRDVHRRAALEGGEERVELDERERAVEDVEDRALHEAIDDPLLRDLADRFKLDLAGGRRHHGREVADAGHDRGLAVAERALQCRRHEVLVVRDGDAYGDAGPLRDLGG